MFVLQDPCMDTGPLLSKRRGARRIHPTPLEKIGFHLLVPLASPFSKNPEARRHTGTCHMRQFAKAESTAEFHPYPKASQELHVEVFVSVWLTPRILESLHKPGTSAPSPSGTFAAAANPIEWSSSTSQAKTLQGLGDSTWECSLNRKTFKVQQAKHMFR